MENDNIYNSDFIEVDGNYIHKTAIINSNVRLGQGNYIGAYTVIGSNGEIRGVKHDEFHGQVIIGDGNIISEHVTIQAPKEKGSVTRIGSRNILMAHVHIGHDATVEDDTEICTSTVIGGYAIISKGAQVKLHCVVRNRIRVGQASKVGMGSVVTRDVPYGAVVYGNPAKSHDKE